MINGENMQNKDNIDGTIQICDRYPQDEEMLLTKAKRMKDQNKTYKFLQCMEKALKINPNNPKALIEIARYLGEKDV